MKRLMVVAACLAVGCSDSTSPASSIALSASTSDTKVAVGGSVSITLSFTNHGASPLQVEPDFCPLRPFEVLTLFGVVVGPRQPEVCAFALVAPLVVQPGETRTYTVDWHGDASGVGPADETIYLAPGTYLIRARVMVEGSFVYAAAIPINVTS